MSAPLTVADVLDRAADLIAEKGWVQGQWQDDQTGCLCIEGAITHAGGIRLYSQADMSPAGKFLEEFLKARGLRPDMPAYNDAPERTKDEVLGTLREAAALAREQGK